MATSVDISPTLGLTAAFLQGGPGASPGYSAIDVRRALGYGSLQEGVIDAGSYMVTQRAAGANMSVDVAASTGNGAYVQGDAVTSQGLYFVPPHSAVINLDIGAADATNPRVDQIVLRAYDDTHDGSGANKAAVYVVAGTATLGATLDNRSGAAALPSSAIRLADILVAAGSTSVSNSSIRDRRPWARGVNYFVKRNANAAAANDYTTTSASYVAIDSTNIAPRVECSGVPLTLTVFMNGVSSSSAGAVMDFTVYQDGAQIADLDWTIQQQGAGNYRQETLVYEFTPSAGSHRFIPYYKTSTGTLTVLARAAYAFGFRAREDVAQNAANNTTTSG